MAKSTDKKGRRAYLSDIQPNLAGEYVYVGSYYCYVPQGKTYLRALSEIILLSILSLAAFVAAGLVRAGGMGNCFYVLLPYIGEAISVFVLLWAVSKILIKGEKLREYVYGSSILRIPGACVCSAAFAAVGLIGILIFTLLNGTDGSAGEYILLLAAKLIAIAAPLLLKKLMKGLKWEIREQ